MTAGTNWRRPWEDVQPTEHEAAPAPSSVIDTSHDDEPMPASWPSPQHLPWDAGVAIPAPSGPPPEESSSCLPNPILGDGARAAAYSTSHKRSKLRRGSRPWSTTFDPVHENGGGPSTSPGVGSSDASPPRTHKSTCHTMASPPRSTAIHDVFARPRPYAPFAHALVTSPITASVANHELDPRVSHHEIAHGLRQLDADLQRGVDGLERCPYIQAADLDPSLHRVRHELEWTLGVLRNSLQSVRRLAHTTLDPPSAFDGHAHVLGSDPEHPIPFDPRDNTSQGLVRSADESAVVALSPSSRFLLPATPVSVQSAPNVAVPPVPSSPPAPEEFRRLTPAETAHVHDLQHQVSTKTLALQTLQQEHERLMAAYRRSQTRCGALERKFQVSDVELNRVIEERGILQTQVDTLEEQVETLTKARDEARTLSRTNGEQYMKIMSMASILETRSNADQKRWATERSKWEESRKELEDRCSKLEVERDQASLQMAPTPAVAVVVPAQTESSGVHIQPNGRLSSELREYPASKQQESVSSSVADRSAEDPNTSSQHHSIVPGKDIVVDDGDDDDDDHKILRSTSVNDLREEVIRLRKGCREMSVAFEDLKNDGLRIEEIRHSFDHLGRRVVGHVDGVGRILRRL